MLLFFGYNSPSIPRELNFLIFQTLLFFVFEKAPRRARMLQKTVFCMPANCWLAAAVPARDGHHRGGEAAARGNARLGAHGRKRAPQHRWCRQAQLAAAGRRCAWPTRLQRPSGAAGKSHRSTPTSKQRRESRRSKRLTLNNCARFFEAAIWRPVSVLGRCYCVLEQSCICLVVHPTGRWLRSGRG